MVDAVVATLLDGVVFWLGGVDVAMETVVGVGVVGSVVGVSVVEADENSSTLNKLKDFCDR